MREQSGFALILTIFLLLFISLLFVALFHLLTTDVQIVGNQKDDISALYIAEAGVEWLIDLLRGGAILPHFPATRTFPVGSGSSYTVEYPPAGEPADTIGSTGTLANGYSRTIYARVTVQGSSVSVVSWEEQ